MFRNWVFQNFPFLEDDFDALTDYELFCKMVEYVKEYGKEIDSFKKQIETFENYFNNLDVQEEINNKLDEMAEDGTLENIIGQYIQLATTYVYNNVAEMKTATNLVNGSYARTSGFYNYNDGGGAYYKIRTITEDDTIDEMFLISIENTSLVAELIYNNEINYLQVGGKINDNTYDSTNILQYVIDKLSANKGGKIYFPHGELYFKGTITLKFNVELIGFGDYSTWNINDDIWQDKGTTFHHIPLEEKNFIVTNYQDVSQLHYQPNIVLKNLYIVGSNSTLNGLYLAGISKSIVENIMIIGCQNNIHLEYAMTTDFIRVYSQSARSYCLLIDNSQNIEISTTTNFYNCYFGQTKESGGSPMRIGYHALVGGNFIDCTFETSNESIEIDSWNELYFTNIYCENIPNALTKPMFKIGETASASPNEYEKGIISFIGGTIYGCGAWYEEENKATIFDVNYINNLSVIGCTLRRADYTVKLTSNTDRITFIGTTEGQIAHGINTYKNSNKILYVNCNNTSFAIDDKTFIPKGQMSLNNITLQNNWIAYDGLKYTIFGNIVSIYFSCVAGTVTNGTIIGNIPDIYRPSYFVKIPIVNATDTIVLGSDNYILVKSNGDIIVVGENFETGKTYEGEITYMLK